jgi:hypothetical protein
MQISRITTPPPKGSDVVLMKSSVCMAAYDMKTLFREQFGNYLIFILSTSLQNSNVKSIATAAQEPGSHKSKDEMFNSIRYHALSLKQ